MEITPKFAAFLEKVSNTQFDTNTTANGSITIQQTPRNQLRREGLNALLEDLTTLYGENFDVVETKDGICLVAETDEFTFTWELKSTIKSLDYDPFIAANDYEEDQLSKAERKAAKEAEKAIAQAKLEAKRAKKLAEVASKKELTVE